MIATTTTKATAAAASRMLIQRRATTCSISSVFYLRGSGMKEASVAENVFVIGIGVPTAIFSICGLYKMIQDEKI